MASSIPEGGPAPSYPTKPPNTALTIKKRNARDCRKPRRKRVASFPSSSGKSDLSDPEQEVVGGPPGASGNPGSSRPRGEGAGCDPSPAQPSRQMERNLGKQTQERQPRRLLSDVRRLSRASPGPWLCAVHLPGWHGRRTQHPPAQARSLEVWSPRYLGKGICKFPGLRDTPQAPDLLACLKRSLRPLPGNLLLAQSPPLTPVPPPSRLSCPKPRVLLTLAHPLSPRTSKPAPSPVSPAFPVSPGSFHPRGHPASLPSAQLITAAAPPKPRGPRSFSTQQPLSAGLSRAALCPASPLPALLGTFLPAHPAGVCVSLINS